MILQASHTHLYPGHRGKISGLSHITDLENGCDCLVEFSDGSATNARISRKESGWQLQTFAYRTAAGTDIAEKRWAIRLQEEGALMTFHILKKE
jgi:hypothetical protein